MQWRIATFSMLALYILSPGCQLTESDPQAPTLSGDATAQLDADTASLLAVRSDVQDLSTFVKALEAVAKGQGWQDQLSRWGQRHSIAHWDEGRAIAILAGQERFVVVILGGWNGFIPGSDVQTLFLLNNQGKLLDQLTCEISSRLTRLYGSGRLHTVVLGKPEEDGARLAVRLDGESARGNFCHTIYHGGEGHEFYWGQEDTPEGQPTKWDTRGLCRLAIQGGQFQVLFPGRAERRAWLAP